MGQARLVGTTRSGAPLMVSRFAVTFKTLAPSEKLGFQSVRGLSFSNDLLSYPEGVDLQTMRHLPGPLTVGDVTFEGGITPRERNRYGLGIVPALARLMFSKWGTNGVVSGRQNDVPPSFEYEDIDVDIHGRSGNPHIRVSLLRCAIRTWELGDLDATSGDIWLHRLIVAPEGYEIRSIDTT